MAYKRYQIQSEDFQRKKKIKIVWGIGLFVISAVTLVSAASNLTQLRFFSIQNIKVVGADTDIKEVIHSAAQNAIEGKYLSLFSKSNVMLYSPAAIIEAVKKSSSRIEAVKVKRDGLQNIVVEVQEKLPVALICNNLPDWDGSGIRHDDDHCYFADEKAVAYKVSPSISGGLYNRYYLPNVKDTAAEKGELRIDLDQFSRLQKFYNALNSYGINVDGVLIKDNGEYELYAASSTIIYLNDRNDLDSEYTNLISFLRNMASKNKKSLLNFDSIDLRYGSNIFYRLSN